MAKPKHPQILPRDLSNVPLQDDIPVNQELFVQDEIDYNANSEVIAIRKVYSNGDVWQKTITPPAAFPGMKIIGKWVKIAP